ncbi:amine sulfotransferase-like [Ruditapes philippinarum]|uniref:amine sulfotransferase-like n=1 Tax=Ruditapes philippinarum TaxID=129788 RepID=UPI00295B48E2|nr:amine sulfotransferase-like [Ruditapes philippinarum]
MTQELVYHIMTLDFDTAKTVPQEKRFPQLLEHAEVNNGITMFKEFTGLQNHERRASPRMIKSHLHYSLLPEQLRNGKGKIVYICRNPKDVVISYYRFMDYAKMLEEEFSTFDDFVHCFVKGIKLYRCPWQRHVQEYWEHKNDSNVLFLQYEVVVEDMVAAIKRMANFLGRHLKEEDILKIAESCHVDTMRSNPMVNYDCYKDIKDLNPNADGVFINKGKPGVWRDRLTLEQSQKIDTMIDEVGKFGLKFRHST